MDPDSDRQTTAYSMTPDGTPIGATSSASYTPTASRCYC